MESRTKIHLNNPVILATVFSTAEELDKHRSRTFTARQRLRSLDYFFLKNDGKQGLPLE